MLSLYWVAIEFCFIRCKLNVNIAGNVRMQNNDETAVARLIVVSCAGSFVFCNFKAKPAAAGGL